MTNSARLLSVLLAATSCFFVLPRSSPAQAGKIDVDFSKVVGTIKPLNGVNDGPIVTRGAFDLSPYYSELGIKHIRLHDVPWTYEDAVDINYVFPRFEADVNDPKSYDFSLTDYYLKSIFALGAEVTFRLGYSAEWSFHPLIHNAPPSDYAKWAAICVNIVKHYNDGWANGYHNNIQYWEIWNEPDGHSFWSGSPEDYFRLYEITSKAIKSYDPKLKVGGPTLATSLSFLEGFLEYGKNHNCPLDFASWHIYAAQPNEVVSRAAKVQALLDKYGFSKTENVLDEWNYFPGDWHSQEVDAKYRKGLFANQMGGTRGAAFGASVLIDLQDTTVAIADFYQGTNMFWGGLYDEFGVPFKPYFTFKAFRFLLATPQRVSVAGSDPNGIAAIAGLSRDKSEATILISNFGTQVKHYDLVLRGLPWAGPFTYEKYIVDGHHDLDLVKSEKLSARTLTRMEDVEAPSVCLLRLRTSP
jgi:xylan 1,4-beta-xylosidase